MVASKKDPVLIVGGSGFVGSVAARTLRRLEPDLPIAIGARGLDRAQAVAQEVGGRAVSIDLGRPDLGLPGGMAISAVVMFVKDASLHSMKLAQARRVPYIDISTGPFEIAPEVALYIHRPANAPIFLGSHWMVGTVTLPVLYFARELRTVDSIAIGAVLDEEDMGGPAAYADYDRYMTVAPNAVILRDGRWQWVGGDAATRSFTTVDGTQVEGRAYGVADVMSLAAATDARSIRFDAVVGQTASRRRGEPFSTEVVVEIEGQASDGTPRRIRHEIVHPAGQAPMTALGVAAAVQRLLGLAGGAPVAPGLYLPEVLLDPETMLRRLADIGARIRRVVAAGEG